MAHPTGGVHSREFYAAGPGADPAETGIAGGFSRGPAVVNGGAACGSQHYLPHQAVLGSARFTRGPASTD